MIDKEKAKVYEILANIICKAFIVLVMMASWIVLLIFLIRDPNVYLSVATAILPLTVVYILRHYFKSK
jgi:hypothetical protein